MFALFNNCQAFINQTNIEENTSQLTEIQRTTAAIVEAAIPSMYDLAQAAVRLYPQTMNLHFSFDQFSVGQINSTLHPDDTDITYIDCVGVAHTNHGDYKFKFLFISENYRFSPTNNQFICAFFAQSDAFIQASIFQDISVLTPLSLIMRKKNRLAGGSEESLLINPSFIELEPPFLDNANEDRMKIFFNHPRLTNFDSIPNEGNNQIAIRLNKASSSGIFSNTVFVKTVSETEFTYALFITQEELDLIS